MKRIAFLFVIGLIGMNLHALEKMTDPGELVWFGLDYSLVRFIGLNSQFTDLEKIQGQYFRSWNELVLLEKDKYNVNEAFGAGKVDYAFDQAIERSQGLDMYNVVQTEPYSLDEDEVARVVSAYTDPSVDQFGALFVMETLNKLEQYSTMWVVVFRISTGEILYMKHRQGGVGGIGFRNYWARSYYEVLKKANVSLSRL